MGTLTGPDGQTIILMPHHTVGRNVANALVVPEMDVSNAHAEISWTSEGWVLLDMSSNGTFLNHRRARVGIAEPIVEGTVIKFASSRWEMTDDAPPPPMAREPGSGRLVVGQRGILALPEPAEIQALVWQESASGWIVERVGDDLPPAQVYHEQEIEVAGQRWVLYLPVESTITIDAPELLLVQDLKLHFAHSVDLEHIKITITAGARSVQPQARVHHQTLFALASVLLRDRAKGVSEEAAGWRTRAQLASLAGVERNTLDQHIFRARQELSGLDLVHDANALVVRRSGKVRIGISDVSVSVLGG